MEFRILWQYDFQVEGTTVVLLSDRPLNIWEQMEVAAMARQIVRLIELQVANELRALRDLLAV